MQRKKNLIAFLLSLALLVTLSACSKKPAGGTGLLDNELLRKLPEGALGFYTWDTDRPGYQKFQKSPWNVAKQGPLFSKLTNVQPEGLANQFEEISAAMQEAGLAGGEDGKPGAIKAGVATVTAGGPNKVNPLVYVRLGNGVSGEQAVGKLQEALQKRNVAVEKSEVDQSKAIAISAPPAPGQTGPVKIVIAGRNDRLAAGTDLAQVKGVLSDAEQAGLQKLQQNPSFQRAAQTVPVGDAQFDFGYFDVAGLLKVIPQLVPQAAANQANLDAVPFESVVLSTGMDEAPFMTAALPLAAGTAKQQEITKYLSQAGKQELLERMPADTIFLLSVDGQVIGNAVKDYAKQQGQDIPQLDAVTSTKAVAIAARGNPMAPFPDVVAVAEAANAQQLEELLTAQLQAALAGFAPGGWSEKEMQGAKVHFALTPLGIGIFLARTGNHVILASSERSIKDTLQNFTGKTGGLVQNLDAKSRSMLSESKPIFVAYTDFAQLAKAMESLGGTLAMFTGGKAAVDKAQLDQLSKLGGGLIVLDFDNNVLRVRGRAQAPKQ